MLTIRTAGIHTRGRPGPDSRTVRNWAAANGLLRPSVAALMEFISVPVAILSMVLEAALLLRARRAGFLSQFPLFYSYITYVLASSILLLPLYFLKPQLYLTIYWFSYLVTLLAEFAVLLEVADHIFKPYPAIRRLGQLLTAVVCMALFSVYIIPALMQHRSSSIAFLELEKRTSLTKAVLIIVLLAAARLYHLPIDRNISGMLLGFATYLALVTANTALAETLGRGVYGDAYGLVEPLGYFLGLGIWIFALWSYEPVLPGRPDSSRGGDNISEPFSDRVGRYNSELSRLFRR
jgi:hypothetical protein